MWVDDTEYNPSETCPICLHEYGTSQSIFTPLHI